MRYAALAAALALASCQAAEAPRQRAAEQDVPAPPVAKPIPDVKGTWKVIALNGRPLDPKAPPIFAEISARNIEATSGCVSMYWTYGISGAAFTTQNKPPLAASCLRPYGRAEDTFGRIMSGARQLRHLTDGGLYITSRTETMVLRRTVET